MKFFLNSLLIRPKLRIRLVVKLKGLGVIGEVNIVQETPPSYSPQSNGIVDRKNKTFIDMNNAMLSSSGLPKNL